MALQHTTDIEIVEALRAVASTGSKRAAARKLGVDAAVITKRIALAAERNLTADSAVLSGEDKLKLENSDLRRELKAMAREADSAERIRKEVFNLAAHSASPPTWLALTPRIGVKPREVPMTMWSDWHYGEVVRPEEVAFTNEFNAEIAERRVRTLVQTTIDICRAYHKPYPGIVVCLGGDMITGEIHGELTDTNDRTAIQQVHELTDILIRALSDVADEFGKVFVPCVPGNHGRTTLKPRMKSRVYTSYEYLMYLALERHFRDDKRLTFYIPGETDAYFKVYSHRFMLTHGDALGVKGGDGIIGSIGPIMRGTFKIGRSEAQIGRDVDTLIIGHWHQAIWGPGDSVFVNNSLKGYDEFAKLALRAPFSLPSQLLWFVHPEHDITVRREVRVEKKRDQAASLEWLTWPKLIA